MLRPGVDSIALFLLSSHCLPGQGLPGGRNTTEPPGSKSTPLVVETTALLESLPRALRNRIYFIHMNHSNPMLNPESEGSRAVTEKGFRIARTGDRFAL
jgi:hypothetical protein